MKKPLAQKPYLLLSIFVTLIIATLVVFNSFERNASYRDNQHQLAKKSITGLSNEIDLYISGLRKQVHLFTDQERQLINQLGDNPLDKLAYIQLEDKILLHYPEHFSWTIAANDGTPLLESFDHLVGGGCRRDIKKFVGDSNSNQVYIHSSPQQKRYHFDIMIPIEETQRVFFISFNLSNLTHMLKNAQLPGHHLLLMRQDDENLIEVTAMGTFYSLEQKSDHDLWQSITGGNQILNKNELRLSTTAMQRFEFYMAVAGTKWALADLPELFFYSTQKRKFWLEAVLIFCLVTMVSSLIILFLKKRQDRLLLLHSEQELKEFINSSPIIMWMTRQSRQDLIYNNAWREFCGSAQYQQIVAGQHNNDSLHGEDRERYSTVFANSLQEHKAFEHEYRQLDKNRQYRWFKETGVPRFDDQNHYQGHTGICVDITEQKQNERADRILFNLLEYSFEPLADFSY